MADSKSSTQCQKCANNFRATTEAGHWGNEINRVHHFFSRALYRRLRDLSIKIALKFSDWCAATAARHIHI
jgi:hypothetical protein